VLLVLITDTGRVEQCTVDLPQPWDEKKDVKLNKYKNNQKSISFVKQKATANVNFCLGLFQSLVVARIELLQKGQC